MKPTPWNALLASLVTLTLRAAADEAPLNAEILEKKNVVDSAKLHAAWTPAHPIQPLDLYEQVRTGALSRGLVRMLDSTTARLDENSQIVILPASVSSRKAALDLRKGEIYVHDREHRGELEIHLPGGTAAPNGTELQISVDGSGKAVATPLEGTVELKNAQGTVTVSPGEQGFIEAGRQPSKTAAVYAKNDLIQWVLYYPATLDPEELGLTPAAAPALQASLAAYDAGDLLGALRSWPAGYEPRTAAERLFRAATLLAVGRVAEAGRGIAAAPRLHPGRLALEQTIAAVKFRNYERTSQPKTAGEWLADSYDKQSAGDLDGALADARNGVKAAPAFGYAWERLAELEFSFGRVRPAKEALKRALAASPRNAQGQALQGFLFSAENAIARARESFDAAIGLDGALANAWLGRGLTEIRQGRAAPGDRDLQAAAGLEPSRSLLHSYLGKAFSQVGEPANARSEFSRAIQIDPKDPTPWLYSAIEAKQENRYNEAVNDLEESLALNDNRRVYRSQFLLDQDRSVRGTNLAAIYQEDGMVDQSVREAVRAVDADYSSAPAHLFLANSYDALRDPDRILLRYETPWFDELLLSNLLSPVGGGPLSQFVSQQEYSKLFEHDGFGASSVTEYYGYGEIRETASQYGTFGNFSYAFDSQYQDGSGLGQPNSGISRLESYGQIKLQPGPQDTVFFQAKTETLRNGYLFQAYDPSQVGTMTTLVPNGKGGLLKETVPDESNLTYSFHENQDPGLLLLGWHHEWSPGNQTLLVLGRLADRQTLTSADSSQDVVLRDIGALLPGGTLASGSPFANPALLSAFQKLTGRGTVTDLNKASFDFDYESGFETYTAELQQIMTFGPMTVLMGSRYQAGQFRTQDALTNFDSGKSPGLAALFENPPARQDDIAGLERITFYAYDIWHVTPWLSLTGGVTSDQLTYPDNFRNPPVDGTQDRLNKILPKAGFILEPWKGAAIRGAYAQSISGSSFDESVQLEPAQVAGFLQAYRTLISESLIGSVAGNEYDLYGLSFEQKLPTRTYLGFDYSLMKQSLDRTIGVFDGLTASGQYLAFLPSSLQENDRYSENVFTATVNQLVGDNFSFGARYRYTLADLRQELPAVQAASAGASGAALADLAPNGAMHSQSGLHELSLIALYNHPSGFFARAEANWYHQGNHDYSAEPAVPFGASSTVVTVDAGPPGDSFWQVNVLAGYRFFRNQCELSCGVLNLNNQDYRLSPLDPYEELPRQRTFFARCKFSF